MNRRTFLKSLAAALTLPAIPSFQPAALAAAASPAGASAPAAAIATKARFWAIYMNGIQGNCTPATLSAILNISEAEAKHHVTRLAAEGVIRPHALVKKTVSKLVKLEEDDGLAEKIRERIESICADEGEDKDEELFNKLDEGFAADIEEEVRTESQTRAIGIETDRVMGES